MLVRSIVRSLSAIALASIASGASAADPVKIGFIYVSPVGESGWSYSHKICLPTSKSWCKIAPRPSSQARVQYSRGR